MLAVLRKVEDTGHRADPQGDLAAGKGAIWQARHAERDDAGRSAFRAAGLELSDRSDRPERDVEHVNRLPSVPRPLPFDPDLQDGASILGGHRVGRPRRALDVLIRTEPCVPRIPLGGERRGDAQRGPDRRDADEDGEDPALVSAAIEVVVEAQMASTTMLQKKLKLGYARASRLVDKLEAKGIVGPPEGSKPRKVLMSHAQYQEYMAASPGERTFGGEG